MTTALESISARLATLLRGCTGINTVLEYYPEAVEDPPLLYLVSGACTSARMGQILERHYEFEATLLLRWQDWLSSEAEVRTWPDTIFSAIEADPTLNGLLGTLGGRVSIGLAAPTFEEVGDTAFRALPFSITVVRKIAA